MPFKYPSMADRLIANSIISDDSAYDGTPCWIWIGKVSTNRSGMKYGVLTVCWKHGPRKGKVRTVFAHREAVKAFCNRKLPAKHVARHLCNNTLCINGAHLRGGTQRQNIRQAVREGRLIGNKKVAS